MSSKALLPTFGGSYLVWGSCMVFYQSMLLLGYIYAHCMQRYIGVARYGRWHPLILLTLLLVLPFQFDALRPVGEAPLALQVFGRLALAVGLPFLALSTVSLVLQRWFSLLDEATRPSPYVLYSASNLGSAIGLLSYPLLAEPLIGLQAQSWIWMFAYALLVGLHVLCRPARAAQATAPMPTPPPGPPPRWGTMLTWLLLSASGCSVLLAVTNVITFDIASVPFLWVLPLFAYLMSFVLAFSARGCPSRPWSRAFDWAAAIGLILFMLSQLMLTLPAAALLPIHLGILFVACMVAHARLVETRPTDLHHLTTFYIVVALGGVLGSASVSWLAPLVSTSLMEYPAALAAVAFALWFSRESRSLAELWERPFVVWTVMILACLSLVPHAFARSAALPVFLLLAALGIPALLYLRRFAGAHLQMALAVILVAIASRGAEGLASGAEELLRHRNFYGIYRVFDRDGLRFLQHGTTAHGREYVVSEDGSQLGPVGKPLGYYAPTSPIGAYMLSHSHGVKDLAMIGLGTGSMAGFATPGMSMTVFELDPDNLAIAETHFSYLNSAAERGVAMRFVFGDGRINLRAQPSGSYDLLIIDAFNSGAIPVHLLTREAMDDYLRVLRPSGVLLIHISNRVLHLEPVVESLARDLGAHSAYQIVSAAPEVELDASHWALITRDGAHCKRMIAEDNWRVTSANTLPRPWTDQFSNLIGAMSPH